MAREDSKLEILRRIRKNCIECGGDNIDEVKYCSISDCNLWPYRFGKTPLSFRRSSEGAELLNRENFKEGARFGSGKPASDCD
jgi:hypothetical protein